jgi:hypothetical protein
MRVEQEGRGFGITLRAFANSASLSECVDFVGRFEDGRHVWQVVD